MRSERPPRADAQGERHSGAAHLACPRAALRSKQQRMIWSERCPCHDQQFAKHCLPRREGTTSSLPAVAVSVLLFVIALVSEGCQSALPPLPNPTSPRSAVRLSPGDVIKVAYADESIPDQTQKIRRDGKVSLPLIGELTAAGKRVIDFQHELVSRYEGKLDNSEVLVTLENGTASVTVSGFANKPAVYTFNRP